MLEFHQTCDLGINLQRTTQTSQRFLFTKITPEQMIYMWRLGVKSILCRPGLTPDLDADPRTETIAVSYLLAGSHAFAGVASGIGRLTGLARAG